MRLNIQKKKYSFISYIYNPIFKSSSFIMMTSILSAGFGFFFWMIAAKFYRPDDVGIATSLVSSVTLIILFSRFGLDISMVRFISQREENDVLNTSLITTTVVAIFMGFIFIYFINLFAPELSFVRLPLNAIYYILIIIANSITILTGTSFIAMRNSRYYLLQNLILGLRVPLLFLFTKTSPNGIFNCFGIAFILASISSTIYLNKLGFKTKLKVDKLYLKNAFNFSIVNYCINVLMAAPSLILPLIILSKLGAKDSAYYYISYTIASILLIIPNSISMSLLVEGSYSGEVRQKVKISLIILFSLLVPISTFFYIFGSQILGLINADYALYGLSLLHNVILSSFFVSIYYIYISIKRIQQKIKTTLLITVLINGLLLGLSYIFIPMFGINGVGYAYVISFGMGAITIGLLSFREGWFNKVLVKKHNMSLFRN